jgi:hypothetical protein
MAAAIDMLCAKRGASCAEIAKALGWSALNAATLKGYAARAKVKVREDGSESPTRFFGTAKA